MELRLEKLKNKYKNNRKKTAIYNFYSKEINNGKSFKASIFDSIFFRVLLFIGIFLLLSIFFSNFLIIVALNIMIMYFISKYLKKATSRKNMKKIEHVKEDLKSKRVRRELSQLNREELVNYSKGIIEKYYNTELFYGKDGIDLYGKINDKDYAIKCIKSTVEDKVLFKKISEFYNYFDELGFGEGIMLTNGGFQKNENDTFPILFIDFMGIKKILKDIDEYPKDEEMDEYILQRYESRKMKVRNDFRNINIGKIIKLYLVFVVFYILSFFVSYAFYYKIASIIVFILATVLSGIKFTEYIKSQDTKFFT